MRIYLGIFWTLLFTFNLSASTADLESILLKINEAESKKLPQTAIDLSIELVKKAKEQKNKGMYVRALTKKILNECHVRGKMPKDKIKILNEEIAKVPTEDRVIVKVILANWYWHYYEQNRYKFSSRTKTSGLVNDDFTTWDLPKIFAETRKLYEESLIDGEQLKKIKISEFKEVINPGNLFKNREVTLYEFTLREFLQFLTQGASSIPAPQDKFTLDLNSEAFLGYKNFQNFKPETTDKESFLLRSIEIYQKLLSYYSNEKLLEQFVDTEINRLKFISAQFNYSLSKDKLYLQLKQIQDEYPTISTTAIASYEMALVKKNDSELNEAVSICEMAMKKFNGSDGSTMCSNLIKEIKAASFTAKTESSINQSNATIFLKYKNVKKLYFRVIEEKFSERFDRKNYGLKDDIWNEEIKKSLTKKPIKEWSVDLAETLDFKEKEMEIDLPNLNYGFYRLFVSSDPSFNSVQDKLNAQLSHTSFWKTDTLVLLKSQSGKVIGFTIDARTGAPLENKSVTIYQNKYDNTKQMMVTEKVATVKSNKDGMFENDIINYDNYFFVESSNTGDTFFDRGIYPSYNPEKQEKAYSALIFTDRAIYRPDQRIHYKVICYSFDQKNEKYEVSKCENVNIRLFDTNHKEIAKAVKSANEFGSFSGDFIAPKNVLTGNMFLQTDSPSGYRNIKVEEYKRPKFEVVLEKPEKQFRIDEEVSIKGKALTYSGAPLSKAKVKFRVLRGVELPRWWHWANPYQAEQEILNGDVTTSAAGEFTVSFKALANKSIDPKTLPIFNFNVHVDVVDQTGETRSKNITTSVGYVSLKTNITASEWLTDDIKSTLKLTATNLDGVPQNASGEVEIFSLKNPSRPIRMPSNQDYYWSWYRDFYFGNSKSLAKKDMSQIDNFDLGEKIISSKVDVANGSGEVGFNLKTGAYVAFFKSKDQFENPIEEKFYFTVMPAKEDSNFTVKIPSLFKIKQSSLNVGETLNLFWGTGYDNGLLHLEILQNGKVLSSRWTNVKNGNFQLKYPITENLKGGFSVQAFFVNENQVYHLNQFIQVKRPENDLNLSFEKIKSKLRPKEKDSWSIKITGVNQSKPPIELLATMYDESLDSFSKYNFQNFQGFWQDGITSSYASTLSLKDLQIYYTWFQAYSGVFRQHPSFSDDIKYQFSYLWPYVGMDYTSRRYAKGDMSEAMYDEEMPMASMAKSNMLAGAAPEEMKKESSQVKSKTSEPNEDTSNVSVRKNLNELAFFYPQLTSDKNGNFSFEFEMPEALTKWKFYGLAHGKNNQFGSISESVVTEKELMVTPNVPRFLRQGDTLFLAAKIDNVTIDNQEGEVSLELINALNDKDVLVDFGVNNKTQKIKLSQKSSETIFWEIKIPEVTYPIIYRIKAKTNKFSDGEEGIIPILSKKLFVQESMPIWISGVGEKKFKLDKLINSEKSNTLKNEKLVIQAVSNPAWYAVQAIPYLEKYYPECTDYVFERLYANLLGEKIISNNPEIEKVFALWKGTDALKSNLQKNSDLKMLSLEETPWVNDAESEEKAKFDVSKFFDKNSLKSHKEEAYGELENRLQKNGWPWIAGGSIDYGTTLYIVTGFGKLRSLGVDVKMDLALKSVEALDDWIKDIYDHISDKNTNNYSHMIAYYLYGRSYFLKDIPINVENKVAVDYFLTQAKKYWTSLDSRMSEANTALATYRFNDHETANAIVKSLRERALHSEEMGMYWADEEWAYWWYRAPIETQARIIELFREFVKSDKEIDEMNVWLIKQKQTQNWKTSRATADVVYSLLQSGSNLLKNDKVVEIQVGDKKIVPEKLEAGTNFFEKRFTAKDIKANFGEVKIKKVDKGPAYGGVYWHYFEDISKITPHKSPLKLAKSLWLKKDTKSGPTLFPIAKEKIQVGDTLVVRVELVTDRDMEYVHMKDMRGSGTEPLNVISSWKYQDGLSYYESTRDTSTNFFFPYLAKGTYVFEYELRIFHRGEYQSGLTEIQSLYAPEFSSHSESVNIMVSP
jgi:hypothetical protein